MLKKRLDKQHPIRAGGSLADARPVAVAAAPPVDPVGGATRCPQVHRLAAASAVCVGAAGRFVDEAELDVGVAAIRRLRSPPRRTAPC
jgi:hypothetical protein